MRRREFIGLLGGAAAAWPIAARAQPRDRARRIGILINADGDDPDWKRELAAFSERMTALGWVENANLLIEYRNGAGDADRIAAAARAGRDVGRRAVFPR